MTLSPLRRSADRAHQMVMGILNVTPDSFSDGGEFLHTRDAVARGRQMFAEGADIVDVGGESTRPGALRVPADEQIDRIVSVVSALSTSGTVSVDTTDPLVAEAAVSAGAAVINDVSASLEATAARLGVAWIAMHMAGVPATMQHAPHYEDVVSEVCESLSASVDRAAAAGVTETWVDPGFGFGKTAVHNLELLAGLAQLAGLGAPLMIGVSRKATMAALTALSDSGNGGSPLGAVAGEVLAAASTSVPVRDRLEASVACAVWGWSQGARMVRVHDVAATVAARDAWRSAAA